MERHCPEEATVVSRHPGEAPSTRLRLKNQVPFCLAAVALWLLLSPGRRRRKLVCTVKAESVGTERSVF